METSSTGRFQRLKAVCVISQGGDYLFAVPMHVCPTTIRYPGSHVINADGDVVAFWEHTARDH